MVTNKRNVRIILCIGRNCIHRVVTVNIHTYEEDLEKEIAIFLNDWPLLAESDKLVIDYKEEE